MISSISKDDKHEFSGDLPGKNLSKLRATGIYLADKVPELSRFYMSAAQNLVESLPTQNRSNTDAQPANRVCRRCGSIFDADNCRVRHHPKKAPHSGRWANYLAKGLSPFASTNTRRRVEKLANARTRTVTTCRICGYCETSPGAPRMPRGERARHAALDVPEAPSRKRKKKKRRKEENAGLKLRTPLSDVDSFSCDSPLTAPSSPCVPTIKLSTKDSAKAADDPTKIAEVIPRQNEIRSLENSGSAADPSTENRANKSRTREMKTATRDGNHRTNHGKVATTSTKSSKKKKKAKLNKLSALLAKDKNRKASSSLSDFLKQV